MAIFDDNLPFGARLMGHALGFTLAIAVLIGRMISAFFFRMLHYNSGSQNRTSWLEPKPLNRGK